MNSAGDHQGTTSHKEPPLRQKTTLHARHPPEADTAFYILSLITQPPALRFLAAQLADCYARDSGLAAAAPLPSRHLPKICELAPRDRAGRERGGGE